MCDAVAFFKHRSEGETNSIFAYVLPEIRVHAFHQAHELLWALDVACAKRPEWTVITSLTRFFGGTIHMMMRRYRFVEEGLTIGRRGNKKVVHQTRQNYKLWSRNDANATRVRQLDQYRQIMDRRHEYMFDGLAGFLKSGDRHKCPDCRYRVTYGAEREQAFGGVQLCGGCRNRWRLKLSLHPSVQERYCRT